MKHKYTTCDRCGKRLDSIETNEYGIKSLIKRKLSIKDKTEDEILELIARSYEKATYRTDESFDIVDEENAVEQIALEIDFRGSNKTYDLCSDCRKAFEKFMRNEG